MSQPANSVTHLGDLNPCIEIELATEQAKSPEPKFGAWCHSTRLKAIGATQVILPFRSDRPLGGVA